MIAGMVRYVFMIVLSLAVIGALGGIFLWTLRRLRKIEDERWGSRE